MPRETRDFLLGDLRLLLRRFAPRLQCLKRLAMAPLGRFVALLPLFDILPGAIHFFTYTVSDGTYSATATITLDVRSGDDDDCGNDWNSCTIFVSAAAGDDGDDSQGVSYIIVNRGHHKGEDDEQSPPQLDWSGSDAGIGATETMGGHWWNTLLDEPMLGAADLSKQCGLIVRRVD